MRENLKAVLGAIVGGALVACGPSIAPVPEKVPVS